MSRRRGLIEGVHPSGVARPDHSPGVDYGEIPTAEATDRDADRNQNHPVTAPISPDAPVCVTKRRSCCLR